MAGGTQPEQLEEAASLILEEMPAASGAKIDFRPIVAAPVRVRCAAVDGGSTVVCNARTAGLYSIRAGYVLREPSDAHVIRLTTRSARTVSKRSTAAIWSELKRHYAWGVDVDAPKLEAPRIVPQMAEAERVLAEFDASRRALHELGKGDLLMLDGSMDDDDRYAALRENLLTWANDRGIGIAAFTKDTSLTVGGVLPFTLELEEMALAQKIAPPWFVDATDALEMQDAGYRVLGAQFDARATPYRIDVAGMKPETALSIIAGLCNDAAYAGYPYPLARVHQSVCFESGESLDLRRELEAIVARRRGHRLSLRLFSNGRDVLELAQ